MILHNIGSKIINVGPTILMPGDSMNISEEISKLPAIRAFCEMGFVMVEGDKVVLNTADGETAAEAAESAATAVKRGRKADAPVETAQQ